MSSSEQTAVVESVPKSQTEKRKERQENRKRQPRYNVVLWNDDDHTYSYVVRMLKALFGFGTEQGFQIAETVDHHGKANCLTTTLEHAELKRDQIHAFGRDHQLSRCRGSMSASIEPIE